jgi:hypothetical protein
MARRYEAALPAVARVALTILSLALLPLAPAARAADEVGGPAELGALRAQTMAIYPDGRRVEATLEFTGSPEHSWRSAEAGDWVTVGSRVTNTSSWRPNSKVNYGMTELARQNPSKKLMKKGAALVNKNRGVATAPTHKIKNFKHDIVPEDQFATFGAYILQFHFDGRNTIIMDPIDEFIDIVPPALGSPAAAGEADIFAVRYQFANISQGQTPAKAGRNEAIERYEGTYWLEEADIYVRSDLFDRFADFELNNQLVFGYLTNSGYERTGWSDDALGFVNPHADEAAFDNRQSDMWKQHQERDIFYYKDVIGTSAEAFFEMLPLPNTVIDIGGNIRWYQDSQPPLGQGPVLIQSKPSAYNGSKKAVTKISWVDSGPPAKVRGITTLKNNLENWPESHPQLPQGWYPTVRYNSIRIAKQKNLDRIVKAIADHCAPMTIRGVNFTCVLPAQIKHTAYVSENGAKQTITQNYYLIDSSALRQ